MIEDFHKFYMPKFSWTNNEVYIGAKDRIQLFFFTIKIGVQTFELVLSEG